MDSTLRSRFDENDWVVQIKRYLDEEHEEEVGIPVSIFNVPKTLLISNPTSYVPQQIAIGPYHYFNPDHYEMERYKVAAAKILQKEQPTLKFQDVVDQIMKYEQRIRGHYQRYLYLHGETLAWMMAVDASFLLEFLRIYAGKEGKAPTRISSRMSHFIDSAGTKSTHNAILRDILMLESQIPLFLLREVLEFQLSSPYSADELLISMLKGFYKEISPFKAMETLTNNIEVMRRSAHILEFVYRTIVPQSEGPSDAIEVEQEQVENKEGEENSFEKSSHVQKLLAMVWKALSKLDKGPIRIVKRIILSKPIKVMVKLPWTMISSFPGVKLPTKPVQNFFSPPTKEEGKAENESSKSGEKFEKSPLMEEINIPSVSELSKAGVRFVPTYAGISGINFDVKTRTFKLPVVCIDVNTGVVLRNLVAYEACNGSVQSVFTRYTELMNGITDTGEDAKFLRKKGIIVNHLKKDEEVAELWNGLTRSIRLTKVEFLDKTIRDVNKYYSGRFIVQIKKFTTRYVYESWKLLTLLAAILMLFLTAVQAFCTVYSCPRILTQVQNLQ